MAVLNIYQLQELKSFFKVLKTFRSNPSATFASDNSQGTRITVVKSKALDLLRSQFSSLSGEEFKNDNFLINFLSKPKNQDEILSKLPKNQWKELSQELATTDASSEDATHPEQATVGEPVGAMTGNADHPSIPHLPSLHNTPHSNTPHLSQEPIDNTPPSSQGAVSDKANKLAAQQETGSGTAVIQKADRLEAERLNQAPKAEIPKAFENAFKDEPTYKTDPSVIKPQANITTPTIATEPRSPYISASPKPSTSTPPSDASSKFSTPPRRRINFSALKPSSSSINMAKNFGSKVGVFFQRNVGKYLTAGRVATIASAGIGAVAGAGFGGAGMIGGGIAGAALPSWVRSGGAGRFLGKVGNGAINAGQSLTNQVSGKAGLGKGLVKKSSKRVIWIFLGFFIVFGMLAGILGAGTSTPPSPATPPVIGIPAPVPAPGTGPITRPVPPTVNPSQLRQIIIDTFGVTMNGYSDQHLQYAYDKFYEVSGTKFISLIRGSTILMDSDSSQVGCTSAIPSVKLNQYPETLFKYALIHELGHVIANCPGATSNYRQQQYNAYDAEGGITYYARNAWTCTRSNNKDEDYAEMIALYLNPSANIQIARCTPGGTPYTNLSSYPLHYNVARSILGDF